MTTPTIKILKFGGASIKDAPSIHNVVEILRTYKGEPIVVIISAMGKTTNALEGIVKGYYSRSRDSVELLLALKHEHFKVLKELFREVDHPIFDEVNNTFVEIDWILEDSPHEKYDYLYDQIVSVGEMVASKIVSAYLNYKNISTRWLDVRDCIRTDSTYREGKVLWAETETKIIKTVPPLLSGHFLITQGFLGGTSENATTTLGREGSDYSAAIFAYALNAESVIIWKDVAGVLNADPRYFPEAKKIDCLSYREAIEIAYYGASVIHPKTIKPLQNKKISLYVRSFINPAAEGSLISELSPEFLPPILVLKQNQILISMEVKDFSFIAEENLSQIFYLFSRHRVKVNLMQNAAISFSVCCDHDEKIEPMIRELSEGFVVKSNHKLELLTIRHYTEDVINKYSVGKEILLEQKSRQTVQLVLRHGTDESNSASNT